MRTRWLMSTEGGFCKMRLRLASNVSIFPTRALPSLLLLNFLSLKGRLTRMQEFKTPPAPVHSSLCFCGESIPLPKERVCINSLDSEKVCNVKMIQQWFCRDIGHWRRDFRGNRQRWSWRGNCEGTLKKLMECGEWNTFKIFKVEGKTWKALEKDWNLASLHTEKGVQSNSHLILHVPHELSDPSAPRKPSLFRISVHKVYFSVPWFLSFPANVFLCYNIFRILIWRRISLQLLSSKESCWNDTFTSLFCS